MVIGKIDVNLEGRFRQVRTKETNLGNLVADVMRQKVKADVALFNSGTLRSDTIHDAGIIKMKVSERLAQGIVWSAVMLCYILCKQWTVMEEKKRQGWKKW